MHFWVIFIGASTKASARGSFPYSEENFPDVTRYASFRVLISIVLEMEQRIHQMDVKTTFLDGVIEEHVYIKHP